MAADAYYFWLGAGGALAFELLKLYELKGKLSQKRYVALARSPLFWGVVAGMLLASGFVAWAVNSGSSVTALQAVMSGIGARSIIRSGLEARVANASAPLGQKDASGEKVRIADAFH